MFDYDLPNREERIAWKNKKCKKCLYGFLNQRSSHVTDSIMCNFIVVTGKPRGCSPINCQKYKPKEEKKKRKWKK